MVWLVTYASSVYGSAEVFKYYGLPWFLVSHWFVMITYVSCLPFILRSFLRPLSPFVIFFVRSFVVAFCLPITFLFLRLSFGSLFGVGEVMPCSRRCLSVILRRRRLWS